MLRLTGADGRVILPQSADTHANEVAVRVHEATGETLLLTPFAWDEDKKEYYLDESQAFTVPPAPEVETELEAADAAEGQAAGTSEPSVSGEPASEQASEPAAEGTSEPAAAGEPAAETAAPTEGEPATEPAAEPTEGEPAAAEPTA